MHVMQFDRIGSLRDHPQPLLLADVPVPQPSAGQLLLRVSVCGVCHTELDEIEGRTPPRVLPCVPGHQVVGRVEAVGDGVDSGWLGRRVGVAWIFRTCGRCSWCTSGRENLCERFEATGRDVNGGYAEFMAAQADYVHPIPDALSDVDAAPLLCAGAIGHRSLMLTRITDGQSLGLTGFGASAHLVLKLARHRLPHTRVFVFARSAEERAFARELGAVWTGDTCERAPERLAAIIDTTPAWLPVVEALHNLDRGGRLVINAIRKVDADRHELQRIDYGADLWLEREIASVANVTRADVRECLDAAAAIPIRPEVSVFPLEAANEALQQLQTTHVRGAKVLQIGADSRG